MCDQRHAGEAEEMLAANIGVVGAVGEVVFTFFQVFTQDTSDEGIVGDFDTLLAEPDRIGIASAVTCK